MAEGPYVRSRGRRLTVLWIVLETHVVTVFVRPAQVAHGAASFGDLEGLGFKTRSGVSHHMSSTTEATSVLGNQADHISIMEVSEIGDDRIVGNPIEISDGVARVVVVGQLGVYQVEASDHVTVKKRRVGNVDRVLDRRHNRRSTAGAGLRLRGVDSHHVDAIRRVATL